MLCECFDKKVLSIAVHQYISALKSSVPFLMTISVIMTLCLDMLSLDVFRVGIGHQRVNEVLSCGHSQLISGLLICMGAHKLSSKDVINTVKFLNFLLFIA